MLKHHVALSQKGKTMGINIEWKDEVLVAKADGRIDGTNSSKFQKELETAVDTNARVVVLDLEHVSYISSAGLRVILLTAKSLQKKDAKFAVCSLSAQIREVFEISGFDKIISVQASQAEAVVALKN